MIKVTPERSWFDHFLVTVGCVLATFSIGQSLGKTDLAVFLATGTIAGALAGFLIERFVRNTKVAQLDGYLWAGLALFSALFVMRLNRFLPEEGFPFQIVAAGALCWMIIFCSAVSWRDQTTLFLILPCIALFGLVGTFDTFKIATGLFFIFLVCAAVLYARVHQRAMLERAVASGVDDPRLLKRDSWRWMAGPEWALACAGGIIIVSLMVAPVLQISLKNVSGAVRVALPSPANNPTQVQNAVAAEVTIGRGPAVLSDAPLFDIKIDRPRYLRDLAYNRYNSRGWSRNLFRIGPDTPIPGPKSAHGGQAGPKGPNGGLQTWPDGIAPMESIRDRQVIEIEYVPRLPGTLRLLSPGPISEVMLNDLNMQFHPSGLVAVTSPVKSGQELRYFASVPTASPRGKEAKLPDFGWRFEAMYTDVERIPERVRAFAREAIDGVEGDWEKARAIQKAIENQVVYNTRAPRTPRETDPVEFFLFDSREGYCDLFASAMTLMAREAGLPARFMTGYIINERKRDANGFFTVRQRDYHAWAEIYFQGVGWVPFDPTEGAQSVDGGQRGGSLTANSPWYQDPLVSKILIGVGIAAGLALIAWAIAQTRAAVATGRRSRTEIARLHFAFQKAIEDRVRFPRRFSQTTREFVMAASPNLGTAAQEALDVTEQFEAALFSPVPPDDTRVRELGARVKDFAGLLRAMAKARA